MRQISQTFHEHDGIPGYRMMHSLLTLNGVRMSRSTVLKYMQELHLHSIVRKTKKYEGAKEENIMFPNILAQDFYPEDRDHVWCTDFTNLEYGGGTVRYNCTIIDLYDRSVIATDNSNLLNTDLAIKTLRKALSLRSIRKGLILHSDQGCQFTSKKFAQFCKENSIQQSMSRAGCPYDNAPMERFYNTLKNEFTYHRRFKNASALDDGIREYIFRWYNSERPHMHNAGLPPVLAK